MKEEASRWWGYLQSLPVEEPSLAIFWNELDLAFDVHDSTACVSGVDGEHARWDLHRLARRRIAGTQLERYLQSPEIRRQIVRSNGIDYLYADMLPTRPQSRLSLFEWSTLFCRCLNGRKSKRPPSKGLRHRQPLHDGRCSVGHIRS